MRFEFSCIQVFVASFHIAFGGVFGGGLV